MRLHLICQIADVPKITQKFSPRFVLLYHLLPFYAFFYFPLFPVIFRDFCKNCPHFLRKKGLTNKKVPDARMFITSLEELDMAGSKFCWCWLHPPMFWRVPREKRGWPSPLHLSHCLSFRLGREEAEITIHGRNLVSLKPGQCVLSSIKAHYSSLRFICA